MKIALVQVASPDSESPAHRLERVRETVAGIDQDVDLIVLPELWRVGFNHFDRYDSDAESLHGPTVQVFAALASERKCLIHIGSIVQRGDATLRNTSILLDATGQIVHHYSKVHVFGYQSRETQLLSPGNQLYSSATPHGVVAATTCYDLRFPGMWTELVRAAAEIVIVPAAWPAARREHWQLLTAARALDNQLFVIACNATGTHGGVELAGHSRIVDPWGRVVVEADDREGVTIAEIDPALVYRTRAEFPVLADRLDDYTALNKRKTLV
ncbi:carbon-nitrogen family hydrolase [Rhodococcus sp. MSC1_016]|jgi:predicted amidohydrolase|uniref:carbon-nitrogen family hydrolase n=1 Tax=Rhodococcus sp. MSC1_016 TaxID=2909266 RepID=UPI00202ED391|nr:carbon-nitrogen family hydrolase [Rhodococcus sp. MSC1_016]